MGGMGPGATRDVYNWVLTITPADNDQEHLEILIHSYPHADRTAAILEKKESPLPTLIKSAQLLEKAGANFLAVPCNTAHYFLPAIQKHVSIPILNMIEETNSFLVEQNIQRVGLLSTAGTAKTGIYQKTLSMNVSLPSEEGIAKEMEAIYGKEGIKAGVAYEKSEKNKTLLLDVIDELKEKGTEAIIMGCTEIPLCISQQDTHIELINPTQLLGQALVREALAK